VVKVIRSAGGVVWRDAPSGGADGHVEIAVVHRNRYDDWSLPKGKLDSGEHPLTAAVREVYEETGAIAIPAVRLPGSHYLTGDPDAEKTVDFWSMLAVSTPEFVPNEEVSTVGWIRPGDADDLLTYAHDRGVVAAFSALPRVTGVAVLVRHARAGSREAWDGPDDIRPLDEIGQHQAELLGPVLAAFRPVRVYSAPARRCVDTVSRLGMPIHHDVVFAETSAAAPRVVADRLRALVAESGRIVVASQGKVIPAAVAALRPGNASATTNFRTPKGTGWVLSFAGADAIAADRLGF
jgi:8-oxo-dGTP pyrophosphatase MutT (NUDIX family)